MIKKIIKISVAVFILAAVCLTPVYYWNLKKEERIIEAANMTARELWVRNLSQGETVKTKYKEELERQRLEEERRLQELRDTKTYAEQHVLTSIEKPEKRERWTAIAKLKELMEDYPQIEQIVEDAAMYPQNVLVALSNNPELIDFVLGYEEKKAEEPVLTEAEKIREFPLFVQWDPRWGYNDYGDNSVVGLAGCGPTCLSMVLYSLTRDESLTPDKIAAYSMEKGYYMYGTGTLWKLMEEVPLLYGVEWTDPEIEEEVMKSELDLGHPLVCAVREGDFTAHGHFIMIYGYDEEGFFVNDPNCATRSAQKWNFKTIKPQIKEMWSYSKK